MLLDRYYAANKIYWNERVDVNLRSWDVDGFLADPARLTDVVAADKDAVGEVRGKSLIHLQCHFGLDTLAWSASNAPKREYGVQILPDGTLDAESSRTLRAKQGEAHD